jgi:hypothetical protein
MRRPQYETDQAFALEYYPEEGRPDASASLTVYTSGTAPWSATLNPATVTLDAVDQALTVAASKGDEMLTVADSSGVVVGRRYIVKAASGQRQEVRAIGAISGVVTIDAPLRFDCPVTTSSLRGHRLAYTISAAINNSIRRNLRAVWEYDVDSVTYRAQVFFDSVLQPFVLPIREQDIERKHPSFGEEIGSRDAWQKLREGANDDLCSVCNNLGTHPDLVRTREQLHSIAIYWILTQHHARSAVLRDHWRNLYKREIRRFEEARQWYDSDHDMVNSLPGTYTVRIGDDEVVRERTVYDDGRAPEGEGIPVRYARVG